MSIEKKIKEIIASQLDCDISELHAHASLLDDLGADSLDIVELIMAMEEDFEVEIPDDAVEKIVTVQDIIDYIRQRVQGDAYHQAD